MLERALRELNIELEGIKQTLRELRVTAVEDRPISGGNKLADDCGETAEDLLNSAEQALQLAGQAQQSAAHPADLESLRHDLALCQEVFCSLLEQLLDDLLVYERIHALRLLGMERGGEWASWAAVLASVAERSRGPLFRANRALPVCWQALMDRRSSLVASRSRPASPTKRASARQTKLSGGAASASPAVALVKRHKIADQDLRGAHDA